MMVNDPMDSILKIRSVSTMAELQRHVRNVMSAFGYDRIVLFSISPLRTPYIERIYWIEGHWFNDEVDEQTYLQRCPVNQHFIHASRPFLWRKTGSDTASGEYQIVDVPLKGALHGMQIPIFGRTGIEGALSLGGMAIDASPRAEMLLMLLGIEAFHCARRLLSSVEEGNATVLTRREIEVLTLVAKGLRQGDIAAVLGISERTVENHLRHARGRLRVVTTAQAVQVAMLNGEISPPHSE